jgi:hypothetical protein
VFVRGHRRTVLYELLTPAGRKLLTRLAKQNKVRKHKHKPLLKVKLVLVSRMTPLVGKPVRVPVAAISGFDPDTHRFVWDTVWPSVQLELPPVRRC